MDLSIFDKFNSTAVFILIDTQGVLTLARSFVKLIAEPRFNGLLSICTC